jgi:hypothetical protein
MPNAKPACTRIVRCARTKGNAVLIFVCAGRRTLMGKRLCKHEVCAVFGEALASEECCKTCVMFDVCDERCEDEEGYCYEQDILTHQTGNPCHPEYEVLVKLLAKEQIFEISLDAVTKDFHLLRDEIYVQTEENDRDIDVIRKKFQLMQISVISAIYELNSMVTILEDAITRVDQSQSVRK